MEVLHLTPNRETVSLLSVLSESLVLESLGFPREIKTPELTL